jgi:hypothetical protein
VKTLVAVLTAALLTLLPGCASAAAAPSSCATGWGSELEHVAAVGGGEVQRVRTATDACWDRVVIDLAGPATSPAGYHVSYVDEVRQEGSGDVVPVPGAAKLQVSLLNPVSTTFDAPGAVTGYPTLRSVVYTGDFEGLGMGIGVRERLPFRVFTLTGPDRIVIDIAHHWA